jgi:hypothetical protein
MQETEGYIVYKPLVLKFHLLYQIILSEKEAWQLQ